ncbi:MAG: AAA family ATPase [Gloeomargaritaceae cyanobacterium C42_A2020_066]|nr:AAA family ATPase [Gloeomargaritaceae cyanobacterium C42_A2020_066]
MVSSLPPSVTPSSWTTVTDDLDKLLAILPNRFREPLDQHPHKPTLIEVVLDLGRQPEARFPGGAEYLSEAVVSDADLSYAIAQVGEFSGDNRAGIERTLHRISALRNRQGKVIGLTCRVGRAVFGTVEMIQDLVETGQSILFLGRPGVGKTTALREVARILADQLHKRVVIIDTSNEIAGDGDVPHPAIGRARRMQVARPELQHQVMIEAVENHMPEVIVIDEIGTELEALAARTIAERGVQLVGTAHGNRLENLIKNPTLADLIGGIQSVTLGDEEARRRGTQKTVLERKAPPTFQIAIEMQERQRWVVHPDVAQTVDELLRGRAVPLQVRTVQSSGEVVVTQERPAEPVTPLSPWAGGTGEGGWRRTGRMSPVRDPWLQTPADPQTATFAQLLETSLQGQHLAEKDGPLQIYPYGISLELLEQVIQTLDLPVVTVKDIDQADLVLASRAQVRQSAKLRHMAKARQVPIYAVKGSTIPQIARVLRRLLHLEELEEPTPEVWDLLCQGKEDDEVEALEEARLAVEQIVIPKGQPVELLPRPAAIRKMQHELVEHYRLRSSSFGDEPNRRLRIFPG